MFVMKNSYFGRLQMLLNLPDYLYYPRTRVVHRLLVSILSIILIPELGLHRDIMQPPGRESMSMINIVINIVK